MRWLMRHSCAGSALVVAFVSACGTNVSPTGDARDDGDSSVRDVAPQDDVMIDSLDASAEDARSDAAIDGADVSDGSSDAPPNDVSVVAPPFFAMFETSATDADPSRNDNPNRPYWFVIAAFYSNVFQRTRVATPGGSCESVAYSELPRIDLGVGEAVLGARVEPMRPRQPNWFRTPTFSELMPVGQEVLVRFSGAGAVGPFSVSSTLPPPTTVLAPRVPMGQPALIASVATPLAIRFTPTSERLRVRLFGGDSTAGALRMTLCDFDGRSGVGSIPPEILRLHPHESSPTGSLLVFVAIDTIRSARVNVGGYDTNFVMCSDSADFGLWLTP